MGYVSLVLVLSMVYTETAEKKQVRILDLKSINQFKLAREKNLEKLKEIADLIDLNAQEEITGNTILHYAVLLADKELIAFLLSTKRVNPHINNGSTHSVLKIAASCGDKNIKDAVENYEMKDLFKHSFSMPTLTTTKTKDSLLTLSSRQ